MEFKEFPEGDAFYVVKWIDRYAPTAPKSAAMSVDVVLQRLPQTSLREIQWLSDKQVRDLLGKPGADAPDPIDPRDPYKHKRWPSLTRRCHAGLLPKVHIGDVFHKCLPVGALPQREFSLFLPGGSATGDNYTLRQAMTGPGWRKVGRVSEISCVGHSMSTKEHECHARRRPPRRPRLTRRKFQRSCWSS